MSYEKGERPKNIFVENFAGQLVEIFTGVLQKVEDEHGIQEVPLAIQGFIIDIDENFIYLGNTTAGISKCVKIGDGLVIEIIPPQPTKQEATEFDDILDNFSTEGEGN